jgi:hypothetical protein
MKIFGTEIEIDPADIAAELAIAARSQGKTSADAAAAIRALARGCDPTQEGVAACLAAADLLDP